jgi:hypothetical protein
MKTTIAQFISLLFAVKSTTFIGFDSVTDPTMRKTNNRFVGLVNKCSFVNALIGYSYGNMVNNAQKRELSSDVRQALLDSGVPTSVIGTFNSDINNIVDASHTQFESNGLPWGDYMVNPDTDKKSPVLIENTNKQDVYRVFAQMAIMQTKDPVYRWKDSNKELSKDEMSEMRSFFPAKKESSRQGLSKPYVIRTYALDNIKSVRMNKESYQLQ